MDTNAVFEQSLELQEALTVVHNVSERKRCIVEYIEKLANYSVARCPDFEDGLEWFNTESPLSLQKELQKKVVVLDFFTYCCINCMHILPDLHLLEKTHSVTDGLVVVGVHSAKFDNEKISSNILSAVLRYDITHPVVNDGDGILWLALNISVWPTLAILGPDSQILFILTGEGHQVLLEEFVSVALEYYHLKGLISPHDIPIHLSKDCLPPSPLSFPGKLAVDPAGQRLAVSDTGHHRIVLVDLRGLVLETIGSGEPGFEDGGLDTAMFHAPQGLCWQDANSLFVADAENHAIRKVDLAARSVCTVVGTGQQGHDLEGGQLGTEQPISTPWDVVLSTSPAGEEVLYIAMAGSHQLWVYCLQACTLLKNKQFGAGTCARFAGSGSEENRNNSYPAKAGFAQPSGLATGGSECLYVADSESSTVRKVAVPGGSVTALVGGERDPQNLFAFGDVDGKGVVAKLQHPLAVAVRDHEKGLLLVADSYNHKIKEVDVGSRECRTILGTGEAGQGLGSARGGAQLSEPGGLSMCTGSNSLYIADTNNHSVKVLDLATMMLSELPIIFPEAVSAPDRVDNLESAPAPQKRLASQNATIVTPPVIEVKAGSKVTLVMALTFAEGLHLTEGAPSAWQIVDDGDWSQLLDARLFARHPIEDLQHQPSINLTMPVKWSDKQVTLSLEYLVYCCDDTGVCLLKSLVFRQPIECTTLDTESKTESIRTIAYRIDM